MNPFVDQRISTSARGLVAAGVILGATFSAMLLLFIAGEMLSDPGGLQGLVMVAAWLIVPLSLTILALASPRVGYPVLSVAVALVILASLVTIPLAHRVWEFEDSHGPINLMVLIGALVPLVALGRAMPARAGWLMIVTMAATLLSQAVGLLLVDQWSVILVMVVLMAPFTAVAILFVLAGRQCSMTE